MHIASTPLSAQLERHTVDVAATLQLVRLELTVGAPDSLLRAHNLAAALCQQVPMNPKLETATPKP